LPKYRLTSEARSDIRKILDFTQDKWGTAQAEKYSQKMQDCFQMLAENPMLGRSCDRIRQGLHRIEHERHVVFYLLEPTSVRIVRVLHRSMLPDQVRFPR